jgi:hypothetical protein
MNEFKLANRFSPLAAVVGNLREVDRELQITHRQLSSKLAYKMKTEAGVFCEAPSVARVELRLPPTSSMASRSAL